MSKQPEAPGSDWEGHWNRRTVESEIGMRDFFDGRHYLLKYLPRHGKIIDAGCGFGRIVFYLQAIGFDAIGVDDSDKSIRACREWAEKNGFDPKAFVKADVRKLPYPDNAFSGYVSIGVVEHFPEGPEEAIKKRCAC